ncbi:EAL domain-containing protein [Rhodobacter capsulatus]|uniref:EAL domain-containing protein n=1 Tax=Rhodobacter capsulatus TaxID=1061 RepID=A0A4U1JNG0_RHOCA|nr:EAL domain-containing protein [Rhodobacter capsulatus]TKD15805.1 EAL domain-containing protein [Rhodobacter capsulatus]
MAEIEARLCALETALAQQMATTPAAAQAELRAALDRLRVSCAEQAAALDLALHHAPEQMHLPGELLRRLPLPVLQLTHALRVVDANPAARAVLGDGGTGERSGVLRAVLSRSQARALTQALDAAFVQPAAATSAAAVALRLRIGRVDGPRQSFHAHVVAAPGKPETERATWWVVLFPLEAGTSAGNPELLRLLIESTIDPVALTDTDGRVVIANKAFAQPFGRIPAEIEGRRRSQFMDEKLSRHLNGLEAGVIARRMAQIVEETVLRPTRTRDGQPGTPRPAHLLTERRPVFDDDGAVIGVFTRARDVTEELRTREVERLADRVFEQSSDAIVITDPGLRVMRVNPAFERMSGIALGANPEVLLDALVMPRTGTRWVSAGMSDTDSWLRQALSRAEGSWQGEVTLHGQDGRQLTCWARITRLTDAAGTNLGHVAMLADLTLLRQTQADNQRMAQFDQLTGLANRRLLAERIDDWIGFASRAGQSFALMYLDLNKFKSVNDSLGHETGDLLLTVIADRLRAALTEGELAARIGGDEFVVLIGNADEAAAQRRAAELLDHLARPLDLPGLHNYRPSAAAGIACYGRHGDSRDALLRNSDLAMYAAKSDRRAVMVYEPSMGAEALRELETRVALVSALENDEFELHFQPIFALDDKRPRGCEALVRWNRPGHGLVMPGAFLPVAAKAGLMPAIDRMVLRRAVAVQARWRWAGLVHADWTLSINQTASSLAAQDWAEVLDAALVRVGWKTSDDVAPPFGLQIELTEDQLAVDIPGAMEALQRLRKMGIALAIDDFGTGYSSLTYLRRMPVTTLKIDASFVRGIEADGDARQIVEAIIGLAKKFGFVALAEGIESEAALQTLIELGCDYGQGYLFERPLPQSAFEARFFGCDPGEVPNLEAALQARA